MPDFGTGERVTTVLDFPSRDGLVVNAVSVDYEPGGFSRVHRHPAGACVYVIDGSVIFGGEHARVLRSRGSRVPDRLRRC